MKTLMEEIATLRNTPASKVFDATPRYIAEVNRVLDMCVEQQRQLDIAVQALKIITLTNLAENMVIIAQNALSQINPEQKE